MGRIQGCNEGVEMNVWILVYLDTIEGVYSTLDKAYAAIPEEYRNAGGSGYEIADYAVDENECTYYSIDDVREMLGE